MASEGEPRIDPKDVAASTGVGAAQRFGIGAYRRRRSEATAVGAGAGVRPARARSGGGSKVLTALIVMAALIAMLAVMIRFG